MAIYNLYNGTTKFQINCDNADVITAKVGGLKVGDMYATKRVEGTYWTISRGESLQINTISSADALISADIHNTNFARPVIALDNQVLISGGAGTATSPYTIE